MESSRNADPPVPLWLSPTGRIVAVARHADIFPVALPNVALSKKRTRRAGDHTVWRYTSSNVEECFRRRWVRLVRTAGVLYYTGRPMQRQLAALRDYALERGLALVAD